jgi:hypothetical protein
MKKLLLFLAILFGCTTTLPAQPAGGKITLHNVSLDSLKKSIETNTAYTFFYIADPDSELLKISVEAEASNLMENLTATLKASGYTISRVGNSLFALKKMGLMTELPDNFFKPLKASEIESNYIEAMTSGDHTARSENKLYRIGDPNIVSKGNRVTLTGYVKNQSTGEPIVDASVTVSATGTTAMTDMYGFYRILAPLGETKLLLNGYGMEETSLMLEVFSNGELNILMKEKVHSLRSITVSAESNNNKRSPQMGVEKLRIERIRHIPVAFGEADVMKVVLTLPGVKSVGESSSGFNVRGGATDQNLILFNDGTIYNPTHLFGLFSAFNPDVVNDIELYKSSIPAKFGGRISSVLEINSRSGNSNKVTGSAGIGLLTGKFHIEGPVVKDRTNFIAGVRTTYSDWILKLLPKDSGYRNGSASFHDVTFGLSHKFNSTNTVHIYAYYSGDGFSFSKDTSYRYNTINVSAKWRSILSEKHTMTISTGYDRYNHTIEEKGNPVNAYEMRFGIEQRFLKANFDWLLNEKHTVTYGLNTVYFNLLPGEMHRAGSESEVMPKTLDREKALEMALFISDKWDISEKLSIDLGIRYALYSALGPATYYKYSSSDRSEASITGQATAGSGEFIKLYQAPEFRASIRYIAWDDLTIKAGVNTMRQNIHMLSNTASVSPVDIWKLSDANIVPQTGWQAAAGLYKNIIDNRYELSLEGYYKRMNHYLDYKSGAVLNMNEHIERDVVETEGRASGVELMIKKPLGKLNGWVSYSYSKTELREYGDKEVYTINNGNWYPAAYDKPHDVKVVLNYKITQRYSISANLDYATGRPVTIPVSKYYYGGGYRLEYSDRNSYRIPDYFRLDLAFNIEPSHNLKLWTHSIITVGVYNVTGRKNAFSVYYNTEDGTKIQGYQLSIFGSPIPYISYTIKF